MTEGSRRPAGPVAEDERRTTDQVGPDAAPPALPHQRFDDIRGRVGLWLGPTLAVVVVLVSGDLVWEQRALAAVFALVIVWWVSEALPLAATAVLAIVLCVLLGVADEDTVFGAFGNDTIFTFLGGFIIARAMTVHGLDRRIALGVLSVPWIVRSPVRTMIAFGAMAAVLSAFISNTATVAMLFPIGLGIVRAVSTISREEGGPELTGSKWAASLMLVIAYGASIGGLITPVGAPHQLIGRDLVEEQTGESVDFLHWMLLFAPIVVVMFVVLVGVLLLINRPEVTRLAGAERYVAAQRRELGRFSRGEANTLVAFATAVVLWIAPGVANVTTGEDSAVTAWMGEHLTEGVAAIVAATLLFLIPLPARDVGDTAAAAPRRRPTLTWAEAVKIDWGVVLLFGAGTVIGSLSAETGLAATLGDGLADTLGLSSLVSLTIASAVLALVVSETTSNTASAGIVVPIVVPIAVAVGVDPLIPGLVATAAAGYGFMLPVSTPPNAIVYGSGWVPLTTMIRSGIVFDVLGVAVLVTGVLLMAPLVGI